MGAPALVIGRQFLFGMLFEILGLLIASPMTAVGIKLIQMLYIHAFLERKSGATADQERSCASREAPGHHKQ